MPKHSILISTFIVTFLIANCQSESRNSINDSGITINKVNENQIDDLALLCKIWGLLKYYHPAVAAGKHRMDKELFPIIKGLLFVKNTTERDNFLSNWIEKFGSVEEDEIVESDSSGIKMKPDFSWINSSALGERLYRKLEKIRHAKRRKSDYHFYFQLTPEVKNVVLSNEERFDSTSYPDAGVRLLALFRYWNIIQYFFPYKYLINDNWNEVLVKFIPRFIDCKSELDYKLNVLSLIVHVNDTHANIYADTTLLKFIGRNSVPVDIRFIENKAVVTDLFPVDGKTVATLLKGDVIDSVNGKSVDELIKIKMSYTAASNYSTALRNIGMELLRTNDYVLNIAYTRNDKSYSSKVKAFPGSTFNIMQIYQKKDTCFKLITPEIAYLYPGNINNNYLPALMSEISKKKGLIVDLRCYPSNFIVFTLGEYLMPNPIEFVKFSKTEVQNPGEFTYTPALKVGKSTTNYYKGQVVILINEITQSQAEYTTMALRKAPGAIVVGSTTAGADGNISHIQLPGGIRTVISGIGVYYPDGRETQRIGIVPDIEIKPTIKGIRENRDEVLEKAIEVINSKDNKKK